MPAKSGMTLAAFVQEWRSNVASNLEASTVRAAESHFRAHIVPMLGALTLIEINPKVVQAFVTSIATGGLSRKTVENVLLTLSSLLRTARAWGYACGTFSLADLTLPRAGVKKDQRSFTASEAGRIIAAAKEPFSTLWAVVFMLGLRISAQRLRCVVRHGVPYLFHLCRFVSVELVAPGETLRRGQLMRLKHAETDPEILVSTDWN
jgi:hypothetical protein